MLPRSTEAELSKIITSLDLLAAQKFLAVAAQMHPDIGYMIAEYGKTSDQPVPPAPTKEPVKPSVETVVYEQDYDVNDEYDDERDDEDDNQRNAQGTSLNFDHLAEEAHYILNVKYDRLNARQQYDRSGDAAESLERCVVKILKQVKKNPDYGTKLSGVTNLWKIIWYLLTSPGALAHEIKKDSQDWDQQFVKLHKFMSKDDIERLKVQDVDGKRWPEKAKELADEADAYGLFGEIREVLDLLQK